MAPRWGEGVNAGGCSAKPGRRWKADLVWISDVIGNHHDWNTGSEAPIPLPAGSPTSFFNGS